MGFKKFIIAFIGGFEHFNGNYSTIIIGLFQALHWFTVFIPLNSYICAVYIHNKTTYKACTAQKQFNQTFIVRDTFIYVTVAMEIIQIQDVIQILNDTSKSSVSCVTVKHHMMCHMTGVQRRQGTDHSSIGASTSHLWPLSPRTSTPDIRGDHPHLDPGATQQRGLGVTLTAHCVSRTGTISKQCHFKLN